MPTYSLTHEDVERLYYGTDHAFHQLLDYANQLHMPGWGLDDQPEEKLDSAQHQRYTLASVSVQLTMGVINRLRQVLREVVREEPPGSAVFGDLVLELHDEAFTLRHSGKTTEVGYQVLLTVFRLNTHSPELARLCQRLIS